MTLDLPANKRVAESLGLSMQVIREYMDKRGIVNHAGSIHKAGIRTARIISNMLSFSRKGSSRKEPVAPAELINKTVVEDHKGWLDVRSTPGKGASFIIELPPLVLQIAIHNFSHLK